MHHMYVCSIHAFNKTGTIGTGDLGGIIAGTGERDWIGTMSKSSIIHSAVKCLIAYFLYPVQYSNKEQIVKSIFLIVGRGVLSKHIAFLVFQTHQQIALSTINIASFC